MDVLRDNCEICLGHKGGVLGNENVVDGIILCDYCYCEMKEKGLSAQELLWQAVANNNGNVH